MINLYNNKIKKIILMREIKNENYYWQIVNIKRTNIQ